MKIDKNGINKKNKNLFLFNRKLLKNNLTSFLAPAAKILKTGIKICAWQSTDIMAKIVLFLDNRKEINKNIKENLRRSAEKKRTNE